MKRNRAWLIISALAFLIAVIWAVTSAVNRARQSTIPPDVENLMAPLNPDVDEALFTKLESRK